MMTEYDMPPSYGQAAQISVCPTSPQINEGYEEDIGFEKPPTAPPFEVPTQEREPLVNLGKLSEEDVREACILYATAKCCFGTKFAKESEIKVVSNSHSYHYQMETYGEKRETSFRTEPYRGQPIDGPENGPPIGVWDMMVSLPTLFVNCQSSLEVPHTAYVKECFKCVGNCRVRCDSCSGRGGSSCTLCWGTGRRDNAQCTSCWGSGRDRCWSCSGTGQVKCSKCDGKGRLKHYKLLTVTWTNHLDYFVSDAGNLPRNLILKVTGREVFKEQNPRVAPINHCEVQSVNDVSREFALKHGRIASFEMIRMQRHTLRAVPISKNTYAWKSKNGEFYVYGFEKKVYFEDYPQKCCCCTCL